MKGLFLTILLGFAAAFTDINASCSATVRPYSTSQTILSKDTVLIAEFDLTCTGSQSKTDVWFATLNGNILPVVYNEVSKSFQVSYSGSHIAVPKGSYAFNFFSEEAIGEIRKAMRSGEVSSVEPSFIVTVQHPGAQAQFWLATHFIASVCALLLWWFAYTAKVRLQS